MLRQFILLIVIFSYDLQSCSLTHLLSYAEFILIEAEIATHRSAFLVNEIM